MYCSTMPKGGIPDRWLDYSAVGAPIDSTLFLPFKVPLKESLCNRIPPSERFTPLCLIQKVPNLGLIIDLTNTFRYYDPSEFKAHNIGYVKLKCMGHGHVPGDKLTKQFFQAVDTFLARERGSQKLIGVHCTHGLNRTGYFICKYMIDRLGFRPDDAIKKFEAARGHKIEREMYLSALLPRSIRQTDSDQRDQNRYPNRERQHPWGSQYQTSYTSRRCDDRRGENDYGNRLSFRQNGYYDGAQYSSYHRNQSSYYHDFLPNHQDAFRPLVARPPFMHSSGIRHSQHNQSFVQLPDSSVQHDSSHDWRQYF